MTENITSRDKVSDKFCVPIDIIGNRARSAFRDRTGFYAANDTLNSLRNFWDELFIPKDSSRNGILRRLDSSAKIPYECGGVGQ